MIRVKMPPTDLGVFGIILLLGGVAHSAGVAHFYVTNGVPDANRVRRAALLRR
jgi:hypothetical protein